ncbi:hypothetical protein SELR_pSRC400780 (plasmid) [Selenomonas ruminantium subsp. lactilytica TAM6421]|uniref:Uncharacterized protein n=1 Tax=Selenomonas ruminantium subsp. lactilytica (strain NBRC 103574 / TAM6421) TaxID=927704 RepID=I0GVE2_SELRL|nr:hypothetical protein [Selenomonas ruminantium]BAL84729.1 hypothetical protein SELR_pSRC400780 [Selenomonas ruminantium subsp. lactilytica TAM6421]
MNEFVNFLTTTDPKLVMDWAMAIFISVLSLFLVILVGSLVAKEFIEIWGLDE